MPKRPIPDWILEDFYQGSAPTALTHNTLQDPEIQSRVATLMQSDQDFLKKYPPDKWISSLMQRYQEMNSRKSERASWWRSPLFRWAACVVSSLLIICTVTLVVFNPIKHTPGMRAKGNEFQPAFKPILNIYRMRDGRIMKIENGSYAKSGDLLQITYTAPEGTHGVILSLDGQGTVTLHYPSRPEDSTLLQGDGEIFLSNSFQLDDAPHFEKFFFITSKTGINIKDIMNKVRLLGINPDKASQQDIDLNDSFFQVSMLILKGEDQ